MKILRIMLLTAVIPIFVSGCTVVGALIGHRADGRRARPVQATWLDAGKIERDSEVEVRLTRGDTLRGIFQGVTHLPADNYSVTYAKFRAGMDTVLLPDLGEKIFMTDLSGEKFDRMFRGFEPGAVSAVRSSLDTPTPYPLGEIVEFKGQDGQVYDLNDLRGLMESRELPMATAVNLQIGNKTFAIPLENVADIYAAPRRTHMWIAGMVTGFLIDAAVVGVTILALSTAFSNQSF